MNTFVKCDECEKDIENWSANIMVDSSNFHERIEDFQVVCKPCTRDLDSTNRGSQLHNLWELSWLKNDYLDMEREIFEEMSIGRKRFSHEALLKINNIGRKINETN
ncbi:hypothetical protein [Jeotgalibacillus campisalis]|uniref:Uncharacterized protein n=1 Tax=Jeotgalibacillus campisalis TaxID=220754 RepID=A0A0C2R7E2_9BACL|nr:hypothetical protein [Jeotgalibacillus campisalis]KIL46170.1 hypothetical protein KR50_28450 [Jeotgalibacillus campisalis]